MNENTSYALKNDPAPWLISVHPARSRISNPEFVINWEDVGTKVRFDAGVPLKLTLLAVLKFLPERVTIVPATPLVGVNEVTAGGGLAIVKALNGEDVPPVPVSVTVRGPSAPLEIAIVTGTVDDVPPLPTVAVTPLPLNVTAEAPARLIPEITAPTVDPIDPPFGPIEVMTGADPTAKPLNGGETPFSVLTLMVRKPEDAPAAIVSETGSVEAVPPLPMVAVTPDPLKVTAVAPLRLVPWITAGKVVPGDPAFGEIAVMAGGKPTLKPLNGTDVPPGPVTTTVRKLSAAPAAIEIVTGRLAAVPPLPIVAVTPDPLKVTAVAPVRLLPTMTAGMLEPGGPAPGVIAVIVGVEPIVNPVKGDEVPPVAVTVTVRTPSAALAATETVIGSVEAVPPLPMVAVTPEPLNVTAEAPVRLEPAIEAPRIEPGDPVAGVIDVIRGVDPT